MADALSTRLAERLSAAAVDATWFGVEHEYRVLTEARQVPFAELLSRGQWGQGQLDPADGEARRQASGAVFTRDGMEAEIALEPIDVGPGFACQAVFRAAEERSQLTTLLGPSHGLTGYSTHLSVTVEPVLLEEVARCYVRHFALPMMLMLDRADSPGLLVRPRPGRLEICGEFAFGLGLEAAAIFALGSVLAAVSLVNRDEGEPPPSVPGIIEAANLRRGWYIDRRAYGPDLYEAGREAVVPTSAGRMSAGDVLERAWQACVPRLREVVAPNDADTSAAMVAGVLPLPCREPIESERDAASLPSQGRFMSAWGAALAPRQRRGYALAPVLVNWELCVFVFARHGRHAFVSMPGRLVATFERLLDAGSLDNLLRSYLKLRPGGRVLGSIEDASRPAFFDDLGPRLALLSGR